MKFFCLTITTLFLVGTLTAQAQFTDDFSDSDFTSNPAWQGNVSEFVIENHQLRNNGPDEGSDQYLSTPSEAASNASWEFLVDLKFSPSGANFLQVYLMADSPNLANVTAGYFLKIGETSEDYIKLYRKSGNEEELLFAGDTAFTDDFLARIKVTRDSIGNWKVYADKSGGNDYQLQGAPFQDDAIQSSQYFGIWCHHTSTRKDLFYLDDFVVTGDPFTDDVPPVLDSLKVSSGSSLNLFFSEPLKHVQNVNNYQLGEGGQTPDDIALADNDTQVQLTWDTPFESGKEYALSISQLKDTAGNNITPIDTSFIHYQRYEPAFREVVINEVMADPPMEGNLPEVEYVELHNTTDEFISLENWQLDGVGGTWDNFLLHPGSFVVVTFSGHVGDFDTNAVLSWGSSGALTNSGEKLILKNANGDTIDIYDYPGSEDGKSWELIDPFRSCFGDDNWAIAEASSGGTPGYVNSIRANNPDTAAPQITAFEIISADSLLINFDQDIISNKGSISLNPSHGTESLTFITGNKGQLLATFSDKLQSNQVYDLRIGGFEDCPGNTMPDTTLNFVYKTTFRPGPYDLIITEIMPDPDGAVGLPEFDYVEVFNNSDSIIDLGEINLSDLVNTTGLGQGHILPGEYVILCDDEAGDLFREYGQVNAVPGFPSVNNSSDRMSLSINGQEVHAVEYDNDWYRSEDKSEGGYSLEMIDVSFPCLGSSNWSSTIHQAGGTPGKPNAIQSDNQDTIAPKVAQLQVISNDSLLFHFDEKLDSTTISSGRVTLTPSINIQLQSLYEDQEDELLIVLASQLKSNQLYDLEIGGFSDCVGNSLPDTTLDFVYKTTFQPRRYDLIITEIMADPDEEVGLPGYDYIEIYNAADSMIDLSEIWLGDETKSANVGQSYLLPGAYAILCHDEAAALFSSYGKTVAVESFPNFNVGGDLTYLASAEGRIIHAVEYREDWHTTSLQRNGGYALEIIDKGYPCTGEANWASSTAELGGTPGKENAVRDDNPDRAAPKALSVYAYHPDSLEVNFNEVIDATDIRPGYFSITPDISVHDIQYDSLLPAQVVISLDQSLATDKMYTLRINQLQDCSGNRIDDELTYTFGLAEPAVNGDILLSEVLFNPFSGGADFIELYNHADKYINLKNWSLADVDEGTITDYLKLTQQNLVIGPNDYVVFSEAPSSIRANYPTDQAVKYFQMADMPSLPNDEGYVGLFNPEQDTMQWLNYQDDFHNPLLEDKNGVSIERINFSRSVNNPNNWGSAAETLNFATPGYKNSQTISDEPVVQGEIQVKPQVIRPNGNGQADLAIINYHFKQPGQINAKILDDRGRTIKRLAKNLSVNHEGMLQWNGTNGQGEKVNVGYYMVRFKYFNSDGDTGEFIEKIVVGAKF